VTRNSMPAVENNEPIVKRTKSGLDLSRDAATDFEFAKSFGGGSEHLPFRRPPFSLICLFELEDE